LLAVGVGLVLLAINAGKGIEWLWGRGKVAVIEPGDALPPAAKVNINAAPDYELAMLPGIGPKTAQAIVEHRQMHGPFGSLEDLMEVRGVAPATVAAIRPYAVCTPAEQEDTGEKN
jgi:competence ComEA-like helix-hairpin-helix protein